MFKNTKITLIYALFFFFICSYSQNSGTIKGRILSLDGVAAKNINVYLKNTKTGTLSDENGFFKLLCENASSVLIISHPGLITKYIDINLKEGESLDLGDIQLEENIYQIDEIVVLAKRRNQFSRESSDYVAGLPIKNIKNPQSYSVVSNELMNEQIVEDITSSMKSITGGATVESNDGNASIFIRGFRSDAYIRNGMPSHDRIAVDPASIERIEVIKGPSATIFGGNISNMSSYGGVVNRVSKKPKMNQNTVLSYTAGSFNLSRLTIDLNRVLKDDQSVLFRVNASAHSEESFQDQGFRKNYMIAPAISFKVSDQLNIEMDAELYTTNRTLLFARFFNENNISTNRIDEVKYDYNKSYVSNDMAAEMSSIYFHSKVNYQLNKNWKSVTSIAANSLKADADYMNLWLKNDTLASRSFIQFKPRTTGSRQIQQDFLGEFDLAGTKNKTLVGFSYFELDDEYQRSYMPSPFIKADDLNLNSASIPAISKDRFENLVSENGLSRSHSTGDSDFSLYFTNIISFLDDKLNLLFAGRYSNYKKDDVIVNSLVTSEGFSQEYFSPKLGITINPFQDQLALYFNYMNGFKNIAPSLNENSELVNWDPEEAKQIEFGVKFQLLDNVFTGTFSYYKIDITNTLRTINRGLGLNIQDGEAVSKGYEFDIIANPVDGLNLVGGYSLNDYEYLNAANSLIIGNRAAYSPKRTINLWLSYRFMSGALKDLGLGFGGNFVSKVYVSDINKFYIPEYHTMDATIFYNVENLRLGLKINNLADKKYWNNYGIPQKPRSVSSNITLTF